MTTKDITKIPEYFLENIDHIVLIGGYPRQNRELIILQRLKYANIDFEEEVLSIIVEYDDGLDNIITILKNSITIMLSESRSILTVDDIHRGRKISILNVGPPPEPTPF